MAFVIALKINIAKNSSNITMEFNQSMLVRDVCQLIFSKVSDDLQEQPNENGLFKQIKESRGHWLNQERTLEYYDIKSGDTLVYTKKYRPLRVQTLDGSVKTLLVDQSQTVAELTIVICEKFGLHNPEEFSLTTEEETPEQLLQRTGLRVRNQKKLDNLRKKLHTDDELNWLNIDKTLYDQGIEESVVLTLRKKFFFSDQNVYSNDPVQLNLLYVQLRDSIINGKHPCTRKESVQLAALQCQVIHGNYNSTRHKPGFLELHHFLPCHYIKLKGIEKSIFAEYRKLHNLSELNAKFRYIQFCRSLRTYGVTFFLVKEKLRYRSKLVPRLLGITRESVMRVDEKTKEVLKTWPFTTIKGWAVTPTSFVLDFGAYSKSVYSVQTTEGEAIRCLISGYVEITQKSSIQSDFPMREEHTAIMSKGSTNDYERTKGNNRVQEEAAGISEINKKAQGNVHEKLTFETKKLQLESCLPMYTASCKPRPQQRKHTDLVSQKSHCLPQAPSRHTDSEQTKSKSSEKGIITQEYEHMLDADDYMTLIKTEQDGAGANGYQSLQARDCSLVDTDHDYDSISSSDNDYQPLLLENMKEMSHSRDSIYQTLHSCPQ